MDTKLKALDYFVWKIIFDSCNHETLINLGLVNPFFSKLVSDRVYKHRCIVNQVYRLPRESWKQAFKDLTNRVVWDEAERYSLAVFCSEGNTDRFALNGDDHIIVTTLGNPKKFIRYIAMNYQRKSWNTFLIKKGSLVVAHVIDGYCPIFVRIYDVDKGRFILQKKFSTFVSKANGSVYDRDEHSLFNAYDQSSIKLHLNAMLTRAVYNDDEQHLFLFKGITMEVVVYNSFTGVQRIVTCSDMAQSLDWSKYMVVRCLRKVYETADGSNDKKESTLEIYDMEHDNLPFVVDIPLNRFYIEPFPGALAKFPKFNDPTDSYAFYVRDLKGNWNSTRLDAFYTGPKGLFLKVMPDAANLIWVIDPDRPNPSHTWELVYFENVNGYVFCKRFSRDKTPNSRYIKDIHDIIIRKHRGNQLVKGQKKQ